MTTATDICNKALARIGVKTFDNAVDAGILAQTLGALTDLHETLIDLPTPVVDWELEDIPPSAVGPLVDELAWYIRDDFSIPEAKKQSLQAAQIVARITLQTLTHQPDDGEPTEINAY
jgi:hypothetical protein